MTAPYLGTLPDDTRVIVQVDADGPYEVAFDTGHGWGPPTPLEVAP